MELIDCIFCEVPYHPSNHKKEEEGVERLLHSVFLGKGICTKDEGCRGLRTSFIKVLEEFKNVVDKVGKKIREVRGYYDRNQGEDSSSWIKDKIKGLVDSCYYASLSSGTNRNVGEGEDTADKKLPLRRSKKRKRTSEDPIPSSYPCSHCPLTFPSSADLQNHRLHSHQHPRDFCPLCRKQMSRRSLQEHLYSHQKREALKGSGAADTDEPLNCSVCLREMKSILLLSLHLDTHKGDFSCHEGSCGRSFRTKKERDEHMRIIHEENMKGTFLKDCPYCTSIPYFEDEEEYLKHVSEHEETARLNRFLCDQCGSYFPSKKGVDTHKRLTHIGGGRGKGGFACEVCDKTFPTHQRLKVHERIHQKGKSTFYTCPHCPDKAFVQKVSYENHLMVHHSEDKRYICPHCQKGFTYKMGWRGHIVKEHGDLVSPHDKEYLCQICYKGFGSEEEFQVHQASHDKLKCRFCEKQFKGLSHLKEHMLRHASIRPFQCPHPDCSKDYVRQQQLTNHLRKRHHHQEEVNNVQEESSNGEGQMITYIIQLPS